MSEFQRTGQSPSRVGNKETGRAGIEPPDPLVRQAACPYRIAVWPFAIFSSSAPDRPDCPPPSPPSSADSTTRCSSGVRSSTPSSTSRRRWCSSRRQSCSRSAGCRSSRRTRSRRAPRRCATTARWSRLSICRLRSRRPCCRLTAKKRTRPAAHRRPSRQFSRSRPARPGVCGVSGTRPHVVLAIGYYDRPNLLNVPGEDLPHVHHYYAEPHPYYRQRVVIVGGGNSAAESALELFRAGAHVTVVHRHAGAQEDDQVLGEARHRKPDQGRVDRRPLQRTAVGDPADIRRHRDRRFGRGRSERGIAGRRRLSADRLSHRLGVDGACGHCAQRDASPQLRSRDVRNQRAGSVSRRRCHLRTRHEQRLHRERPVPRREDRRRPSPLAGFGLRDSALAA